MLKLAYVTGALMLIASPAIAQTGTQPAANAEAKKTDANKVVCKKEETIGSRLGAKRVCLTVREWQDLAEANREHTEDIQKDSGFRRSN